jgi:hypothetical protein
VLSLLVDAVEQAPLICVVDDARWLDKVSAQTLAFVARRLLAERIGVVLAVREPSLASEFAGLPQRGGAVERQRRPGPAELRDPGQARRTGSQSHRRRNTGQPTRGRVRRPVHGSTPDAGGPTAAPTALIAEARAIGEATGSRYLARYVSLVTEPWKGREAEMLKAIDAMTRDADLHQGGAGNTLSASEWAKAVLCNGLGRYEEACAAAERGAQNLQELGLAIRSMVELVEAAARSGRPVRAAEAAHALADMAQASGTDWALGTSAMVRAQVNEGPTAEALYQEAIERLGRTDVQIAKGRSHLLYGEWLRGRTAASTHGSNWASPTRP